MLRKAELLETTQRQCCQSISLKLQLAKHHIQTNNSKIYIQSLKLHQKSYQIKYLKTQQTLKSNNTTPQKNETKSK